jgi:peptidyl-prolyl cis-trans isomerase D
VAFSTPAGQISDIVESRFGLHIIKVEEVKEASEKSFDEVKEEIATTLIRDNKGPELARKQAEGLKDAWVNNKPELAGLLEADGLKIDETGLTNRMNDNIRGIGKSKELADAAFALRAGNPPPNELFTVGESLVLIRFKERQEADGADFEKQKSSLETRARREKEKQVFDAWMDGLKAKAKIETNLAATVGT